MDTPEFSFKSDTLTGMPSSQAPKEAAPISSTASPLAQAEDTPPARPSQDPDPGVELAYRWAKLYEHDVEFEDFFQWIDKRSNPERTDFKAILESIPEKWGPEDLPPPLRRFFLALMTEA